jgi:hypothetical protein
MAQAWGATLVDIYLTSGGVRIAAHRGASANMPLRGQIVNGHTYPVEATDRRNSMQKIDITSVDLGDLLC